MTVNESLFNNLNDPASSDEEHLDTELEETEEETQTSDEEYSEEYEGEEGTEDEEETEGEEGTEEKLYADRFKNVEELEKAYKELQKRDTKLSQSLQEIKKQQQPQQDQTSQQGQPQIPPELAQNPKFQELARNNPQQAQQVVQEFHQRKAGTNIQNNQAAQQNQQLQNEVGDMKMQMEVMQLQNNPKTKEEFNEVAQDLPVVFNNNPWLWDTPSPVTTAFKLAKAEKMGQVVEEASEKAVQKAYEGKSKKKKAKGEKQKAKKSKKKKSSEEEIAEDILSAGGGNNAFLP